MSTDFRDKRFIFICGHHRSGTSLIHKIIRDNPNISGFKNTNVPEDEGQHLQNIFKIARNYGGPGKYIFNKKSHMNENHVLANDITANKLFDQWSKYWDLSKDFLVEKSPPNIVRTRFFQKLFPNSFFINIYRDPIAVSYATKKMVLKRIPSILSKQWRVWSKNGIINLLDETLSGTDIVSLLDHTLLGYEILEKDTFYLKNHYSLKYEDFVSNPQEEINKVLSFLGLPESKINLNIHSGINKKYYENWKNDLEGENIMSKEVLNNIKERMNKFDYSLFKK